MTNFELINKIITLLGDEYEVINSYNSTDEIDLNGVLAVTISNRESLHHGNSKDCKIQVMVSGQYLTDEDLTQEKINQMFDYALEKLDCKKITADVDDVAGSLITTASIDSDGECNNFNIAVDLYCCID